jgi:ribosomal-protein-alanine N-acetyltransferase
MPDLNFTPFPELTTPRLELRELSLNDAEEIFLLRSERIVNAFIDRKPAITIDDARQFINLIINNQKNNQSAMWAITLKDDPKLIGTIVCRNIVKEDDKAEIGYELLPPYHGQGIMQETLLKVIGFCFKTLGLKIIDAHVRNDNHPSIKLLEKCGFVKKAIADGGYLIYELRSN